MRSWLASLLPVQSGAPLTAPSYLQEIIEHFSQNDKTSKKNGILLAPKQGKKNLAKFLGIDMSALTEAEHGAGLPGKTVEYSPAQPEISIITGGLGVGLDCESVSLSSSTTSGGRRSARILGMAIPGIRNQSRGASVEKQGMEDIPEQLRTPKVPQVSHGIALLLSGTFKSPVSFLIIGQ